MKTLSSLLAFLLLTTVALAQTDREPLFTTADGTRIHYEKVGNGPAVLLIHGFIVNGESWRQAALPKMLVDSGYTVVTLDLRGNGRSDKPHALEAYQNDAEVKDVAALMQHLGVGQYDVVGYSRGSIIAARLLAIAPKAQVRRAVLGGMGIGFTNPTWFRRWNFYEALAKPGSQPQLQSSIDYALKSGADTVALKRMQQAQPVTSVQELNQVLQPVLVISGDQDTDNGPAAELAAALRNSTLASVPGTHNTTMATPEFARQVVLFLRKK